MAKTLELGNGKWATGKDTVLAYNDENNNFKPLLFDFTRASNATVVNKAGLIETVGSGEPRIDFKDDAKGALLLEPSRTNNLLQSNQFDTTWIDSITTKTSGYLGLDGTNSAWLLTKTASSNANIRQNITFSGTHTFSVYLKKGTFTSVTLRSTGGLDARVEINLIDGTTSGEVNATSVKTELVGNDWWRCSLTFEAAVNTAVRIYPDLIAGTTAGDIYIWGAQLEQGSYATSYIPTYGSAVTRVADNSSLTPPDGIISLTEGTFYVEYPNIDNTFAYIALSQSGNYVDRMLIYSSGNNRLSANFKQSGTLKLSGLTSAIQGVVKAALSYSPTGSVFYVNGTQIATGTSSSFGILNEVELNSSSQVGCKLTQIKNYNTRLSNAELIALTTI
tara:strand:- start:12904 stop:14076 length:1173 start_codon:yes stop_codon:yes gene_type:complete